MSSCLTITLFSEQLDDRQQPTSFVVSILLHCVALGMLSFGIMYAPRLDTSAIAKRYTVRRLDLDTPEQKMRRAARGKVKYPGPRLAAHATAPGGKTEAHAPALRVVAQAVKGPQTLVQPDLPSHLTLAKETPVPTVILWSPQKNPVKNIVAPLPEKPTAADVRPSLDKPNEEVNLADLNFSSSALDAQKLPILPSTTSPIVVHGPQQVQLAPVTVSQPSAQPTPTAVLSLSDLQMPKGTASLPPLNETASSATEGELALGKPHDAGAPGSGNPSSKAGGAGAGYGSSNAAAPRGPEGAAGKASGAQAGSSQESEEGLGNSTGPTANQITLPKDGQFGAVVVGASLEDQFPEMAGVWSGRMSYTVYLHVGLARSWILQYSLPRRDEAEAGGSVAHLEAPWPYNIVRPNLAPGAVDADALMIHGFVNQAGRFENLSVLFPPEFNQIPFVLKSLEQWQFRPAMQGRQIARVEVMLIIPEELK